MWSGHDQIREIEKGYYELLDEWEEVGFHAFRVRMDNISSALAEKFSDHFYKENKILFPAAMFVIEEGEWRGIREEFDEIGYCCFTPEDAKVSLPIGEAPSTGEAVAGRISFETGSLSKREIEALLDSLPFDVTFVDKDDTVRYFSQSKDRIFVRTKAVIGRKVQNCHPKKSVHVVNRIMEAFKKGEEDVAEFWINLEGRLIYIRYFPVYDKEGEYLGVTEVTQDITDIQKIEGERRLLDWGES